MTLREFAKTNPVFLVACKLAKVENTKRQASKYQRGFGRARQEERSAKNVLEQHKYDVHKALAAI